MSALRVMIDARMCDGRPDGVTRYVTRLIRELSAVQHLEVVALCGDRVPDELGRDDVDARVTDFDRRARAAPRRWWWEQRRLPAIIRRAGVDLYHATWNTGIPSRCPVPALLTIHDLIPLADLAEHFPSRVHRWSYLASLRTSVRRADHIVTVSNYVRNDCVHRLRISETRVTTIHHGVDPPTASTADGGSGCGNYVLYVGGAEKRKNIAGVLQAMDRLWQQTSAAPALWLTGSLDRQCPATRDRYATLRHPERVRFLGSPVDADIRRLMTSAGALVMLSTAEGFGLPVLEALACGCPVVVSNRTSLPEVVGDAGIIVDPDDTAAVADAVLRITQSEALRADLIDRGLRRAATFSWTKTAAKTLGLYRSVLTGDGASRPQGDLVMDLDVSSRSPAMRRTSLVMTVLNEASGTADVLRTLAAQTRMPDEVIVVDGGSTDGTAEVVRRTAERDRRLRLISAPGANIARGRNLGIEAAVGEIIILTDSGCRLDPRWVERIVAPFDKDAKIEFVAGFYKIDPHGLLEAVVGSVTMRGALGPVDPATFNPSCRSMGLTKELWKRVGGFPEWLYTAEDTLFDYKVRRTGARWHFAEDAVVYWRPRTTLSAVYRQFRGYAVGMAHIGRGARDALYHARNLALVAGLLVGGYFHPLLWVSAVVVSAYFYVCGFHRQSRRVAVRLGTWRAYPLSLVVHWLLALAGLDGQLRALCQRRHQRRQYREMLADYLGQRAPHTG